MSLEIFFIALFAGAVAGNLIARLSWCVPQVLGFAQAETPELCDTQLPWYSLFPFISWWSARKHKIAWRYPLIEIFSGLLLGLALYLDGLTLNSFLLATLFLWLLLISVIDFEHHLILDALSLPLVWLGLLINAFGYYTSPKDAILGAIFGYGLLWFFFHVYRFLAKKEAMGYGDFKLMAALGAWFGVAVLSQIIIISALTALVGALILMALRLRKPNQDIAYGPYIALAGVITVFLTFNNF